MITHYQNEIISVVPYNGGTIYGNPDNYKLKTKCEALDYFAGFDNYDKIEALPDDQNCPC
ncbi:hypothetical protein GCM10007424_23930 [Flavobacterium suaedae]|uniref:Uncharacterized protein n=1 Tax=Flavobacterium suaedae TaxID=1767027 RepID=A0ABQ1K3K4_9FLAO|nr:hypothetical protein [Flavobacterium suaedae]GGB83123.1 hypothetical protein GCM10007424_23930 [Flavobacterium suaedae]